MTNQAKIYTYSVIYVASEEFAHQVPYVVAVVEDDSSKFVTRIEGFNEAQPIEIGMSVSFLKKDENGMPIYTF